MKIFISKSAAWPKDLFTHLASVAPNLFSEEKATPNCRGHFVPTKGPVAKSYIKQTVETFRFKLPPALATRWLPEIKEALKAAAKREGAEYLEIAEVVRGKAGVGIAIDAKVGECAICYRKYAMVGGDFKKVT